MAEKLFPERRRCKACGKGLGLKASDPVLKGLYCTPRCAGMAQPATDPAAAPRECVTQRDGGWAWKRRYRSASEVPDKIAQDPSTNLYWCGHCGNLHVGHTRIGTPEAFRMFESREDLADLLVKLRGAATHRQVGAAAGIRPIRIKEWEDAKFDAPSLEALFKLLRVYNARLGSELRRRK